MPHLRRSMIAQQPLVRDLARLVWLLVYRPTQVEEQKRALREILHQVRDEGCRVSQSEVSYAVASAAALAPRPEELPWLTELVTRMGAHAVRSFDIHQGARAAEVLGLCRALATHGAPGDDGAEFDAQILALAPMTLTVNLGRDGFVRTPTPPGGMRPVGLRPSLTPPVGVTSVADAIAERAPLSALEIPVVLPRGSKEASTRMVQDHLMPLPPDLALSDLFMRLRGALTPDGAPPILDEIGRVAEDAARRGRWSEVIEVAGQLLDREADVADPDVRRAFGIQFRRLAKTGILRGVIEQLVARKDLKHDIHRFLVRQGDAAADQLVEMLVAAEHASARRAYRDAILKCPGAAEPLTHLLRDHRWYVVRNAAELLGELNATEADQELINILRHPDSRVRRAATLSLIRLKTPRAMHTMLHALQDAEASVRQKAAIGLGTVRNARAVPALLEALDREEDEDVQHAILGALGHQGGAEAVARLVKESSSGSVLRRRPVPRRVAAVGGLAAAGDEVALSALRGLARDREQAVRDAAARALADEVEPVAQAR